MVRAKMVQHNGSPAIEINGRILPPMSFTAYAHTRDREYLRELGKAGIEIFFLICDPEWLTQGAFNQLLEDTRVLVEEVPNAKIFLRLGVHPSVQWLCEHPEEIMRYQDGSTIPVAVQTESYNNGYYPGMYALCSQVWREEAIKHILGFLDDLRKTSYADHFIGVFLAGGNTSEWYPSNKLTIRKGDTISYYALGRAVSDRDLYGDFSPAFKKAFSLYLQERYGSEEELRRMWNDPEASFDSPPIPTMNERSFIYVDDKLDHQIFTDEWRELESDNHVGSFLNADKYSCVADFYRAFHQSAADSIIYFSKQLKAYDDGLLVGAFYGYFGCLDYYNMCMCAGALKMLDSGYVDMTACPNLYISRQPGGYAPQRVMQDSFRLRNKMFFSEDDTRTHRDRWLEREYMEVYTAKDSIAAMKRDFGRDICQDIFGWWFDQAKNGRYRDEELYRLIARQQEIAQAFYAKDRKKHNDVAIFYDEESVHYLSAETLFQMIELNRGVELPRMGIPADFYYHNDIGRDDLPEYKLYIFVNCFCLNDEERAAIHKTVRRCGKTALFIYGQGFINPDSSKKLSAEHISELTGMRIVQHDAPTLVKFKIDRQGALASDCDAGKIYGVIDEYIQDGLSMSLKNRTTISYPLFVCDDPRAQTLGSICSNGLPAISALTKNGYTSIFSAAKWITADIYRAIGRMAGCHIYSDEGDYLFANERFLTIHAKTSGEKIIRFKRLCDPYEVYERKLYAREAAQITVSMLRGETLMFSLDGEV